MPHVGDSRRARSAFGCSPQSEFLFAVIPQVDSEMVSGVTRVASEDLLKHRVDGRVALDIVPLALVLP